MAQTAPRVKVVLLLWQLRSAGQFFRARNTNRMYRTTCFAPKVTSLLPFKVRFRSHCTLERSKPLLIRPAPQDHLQRWSGVLGPEVHFLDHFDRSHSPKNRS